MKLETKAKMKKRKRNLLFHRVVGVTIIAICLFQGIVEILKLADNEYRESKTLTTVALISSFVPIISIIWILVASCLKSDKCLKIPEPFGESFFAIYFLLVYIVMTYGYGIHKRNYEKYYTINIVAISTASLNCVLLIAFYAEPL